MNQPFLSIIIPAYNEAKRLPLTLTDINQRLASVDYDYEIIVVDDGSADATIEIVKRFQSIMKNLYLITNSRNHGKGWVVRQGMLTAHGQWRLFTDADNSTSIDHFEKMRPYLKEGFEVLIGSRDIAGSVMEPSQSWYKRLAGNLGNWLIQLLLLPGLKDTQCGFKCFSAEAAEKIFKITNINRWGFDVEVLVLAKKFGYKIKEIPVYWRNDPSSKVKLSSYFNVLGEVFKIRWWLWFNKYKLK